MVLADGTPLEVGRVPVASRVDLGTVEGLARLQVGARRRGWRLALRHPAGAACPLSALLDLVGLSAQVADVVAEAEALLGGAAQAGSGSPSGESAGGRPNSAKRSS